MSKKVTDYALYRWRFPIVYGLLILVLAVMVTTAILFAPGGLSAHEIRSASSSAALNWQALRPDEVINLPYALVQKASFELLGFNELAIKIPSAVFGMLSIVGLILLLRVWFRDSVAIMAGVMIVTTSQFLLLSQSGQPAIMYFFWPTWLLLGTTMLSRGLRPRWLWLLISSAVAALSLYTPFSIYILLALGTAVIFHPHLRFLVRRLPKIGLTAGLLLAMALLSPLIWATLRQPVIWMDLLAVPTALPDFAANFRAVGNQYFNFFHPSSTDIMTPVYSLPVAILALLGLYQLLTHKYTARSYVIGFWLIVLVLVAAFYPEIISVTVLPVAVLIAMGFHLLTSYWYKLFPRNPYARVGGLIPVIVLVASIALTGFNRYVSGYRYDPSLAKYYTNDLQLIDDHIAQTGKVTLSVSRAERPLYEAMAAYSSGLTVIGPEPVTWPSGQDITVTRSAQNTIKLTASPKLIITSASLNQADRFYIYNLPVH